MQVIIGLISDTHGLLRPSVYEAFEQVELILHAGDVGGGHILSELKAIAPIRAVYGNTDPAGEHGLAQSIDLCLEGVNVHVSHGHELGSPTPAKLVAAYSADVIVYGHTHKPLIERVSGALIVNPGAAGPKRFNLGPSVAILTLKSGRAEVRIVAL